MSKYNEKNNSILGYLIYLITKRGHYFIPAIILLIGGGVIWDSLSFSNIYYDIGGAFIGTLIILVLFIKTFNEQ